MGTSSDNRRARTRAIRARMTASGEPYSVAARRVAAEQTSHQAGDGSPATHTPSTRKIMNDTVAMRDALLDWACDQAGGDTLGVVPVTPFATQHGLDLDAGFTLVDVCEASGMAKSTSTFGNPSIILTPEGLAHVQERRRRQADPALRAAAARSGLLRWMYRQHIAREHMPLPSRFVSDPGAVFEGSAFTENEIELAAEYLAKRNLIKGPGAFGHRGPLRADITPDGMDCVVDWSANVSAYLRRQESTGSTYNGPVFNNSTADGAQIAWNNHSVIQNNNRIEHVAPGYEALAEALTEVLQQAPAMGLSQEDREDVDAASNEILAEIVRDEPRPGPIRRAAAALRALLTPIAAAGAAGAATGVSDGAQEAARTAIELISPF
ncbi:hypothetical protein PSN13_05198 [Micromonospora saelicesensis]|uniref:Uncharacterized protein n=1 Tax=Micromonospora saelicesensis TaxID=285676 RepID=A0A328NHI5_9ACTN|nr:hypothetical protein [Micromonospora saelicesensis]RAO29999.1 hypothetical protein PSN13_05198 [Micromonospora saelicesensis]